MKYRLPTIQTEFNSVKELFNAVWGLHINAMSNPKSNLSRRVYDTYYQHFGYDKKTDTSRIMLGFRKGTWGMPPKQSLILNIKLTFPETNKEICPNFGIFTFLETSKEYYLYYTFLNNNTHHQDTDKFEPIRMRKDMLDQITLSLNDILLQLI